MHGLGLPMKTKSTAQRFWEKVEIRGADECWPWKAFIHPNGYGGFRVRDGVTAKAHRYAYEFTFSLPVGKLDAGHLCNNRACVNPWHVTPQTRSENMLHCIASGRDPNVNKTHCRNGHEFDEANTFRRPDGNRDCRICRRERGKRYDMKRRAK